MAFRNIPLDLTLPPGGKLIPGSGTVYIGGPHLPTELQSAGVVGALVFYSNAADSVADYYFIGYFQVGTYYGINMGYKRHSDGRIMYRLNYASNPSAATQLFGPDVAPGITSRQSIIMDANGIHALSLTTGFIDLTAPAGVIVASSSSSALLSVRLNNSPRLLLFDSGRLPGIKADATNTDLDQWHTDVTTQTIGGVANFQVNQAWRMTPDYVVDYRCYIAGTNPFPAVNVVAYNLPAVFPTVDSIVAGGGNLKPFIPACGEGGAGFYPMSIRFETNGTATLFTENNPQGNTAVEAGGTFTSPKP